MKIKKTLEEKGNIFALCIGDDSSRLVDRCHRIAQLDHPFERVIQSGAHMEGISLSR
jgi:hypothetical protein